jgi:hypothetical protein
MDALLLNTNLDIGLLSDNAIMDMMERGQRGGITILGSQRYVKSNNNFITEYDETQKSAYSVELDTTALYATAMSGPLPSGESK